MSEFVYEVGPWIKREQVAREAGVELDELSLALSKLVARNYFGYGCEEGTALFAKLRVLIAEGASELGSTAELARRLGSGVTQATRSLESADESNSSWTPR